MSRIKTIPAVPAEDVTQRVTKVALHYNAEIIRVEYETVETGKIKSIDLPTSAFNTIVTVLNPDRLWTYIDNQS